MHGSSIVIPESNVDQEKIINIISNHKTACLETTNTLAKGKFTWLGMERIQRKWYKNDLKDKNLHSINYTNWDPDQCTAEPCGIGNNSCPYIDHDGLWAFGLEAGLCLQIELCVVCSFTETPVLNVKGMCSEDTLLDSIFYMDINEKIQVVGYDGYQKI